MIDTLSSPSSVKRSGKKIPNQISPSLVKGSKTPLSKASPTKKPQYELSSLPSADNKVSFLLEDSESELEMSGWKAEEKAKAREEAENNLSWEVGSNRSGRVGVRQIGVRSGRS
ncbi:hypothetical protein C8Q75DRAFT_735615 [Abortiporus biennis]|nr:hypothetical protein C8Q75DRAFT_735615 [Abortiporus biennis]